GAGRDAARQAGRARHPGAEGRADAGARCQPDGCAACEHRRRDQEEAGRGQYAQPHRRRREAEGGTLRTKPYSGEIEGSTVAFTGRLASMKRADAFALVRERGGNPREGVTKRTDVLVVGEFGWPLVDDGKPSNSLAQARSYGVPVASERQFLAWLGKAAPDEQAKTYTADQLASLSKLPAPVIEQLAMFGLIEPKDGHYGFRDLAAARQIAGLVGSGVALSVITRSLHAIRKWLPDAQLSNLRLFPESADRILIEQMQGRTDKTGQFMLPVAAQSDDPDALFEAAQAADESQDSETAERLYRRLLKVDPADSAGRFNLANLLRADGRTVE